MYSMFFLNFLYNHQKRPELHTLAILAEKRLFFVSSTLFSIRR